MRIALLLPSLHSGGAQRAFLNLAEGFIDDGHDSILIVCRPEGKLFDCLPQDLPITNLAASGLISAYPRLIRTLREFKPDVVFSALEHTNLLAAAAKPFVPKNTKILLSVRNTLSRSLTPDKSAQASLIRALIPVYMRYSDGIVTVSEGVRTDLITNFKVRHEKLTALPSALVPANLPDLLSRETAPSIAMDPGRPLVVASGRLCEQKDFHTLLHAFSQVHANTGAKLIIMGDGPLRAELHAIAIRLDVEEHVEFTGFIENPYPIMARADVFVLSSKWEGMPGVLVQALALGLKVVSTDCPAGPAELLSAKFPDSLVPVADHARLAERILETLQSATDESESLKALAQPFSQANASKAHIEFFRSVINDAS